MRGNLRLDQIEGRVEARCIALSDSPGRAGLCTTVDDDALGPLARRASDAVEVATRPGDDLLARERVDVEKTDVEGAELAALRGLEGTLANPPSARWGVEWDCRYRGRAPWDSLAQRYRVRRVLDPVRGYEL